MRRVLPLSGGRTLPLGSRTYIMGILNATPDSFSDGGQLMASGMKGAVEAGRGMVEDGADVLDVGGQSTRPGAERVGEAEEAARVLPLLR